MQFVRRPRPWRSSVNQSPRVQRRDEPRKRLRDFVAFVRYHIRARWSATGAASTPPKGRTSTQSASGTLRRRSSAHHIIAFIRHPRRASNAGTKGRTHNQSVGTLRRRSSATTIRGVHPSPGPRQRRRKAEPQRNLLRDPSAAFVRHHHRSSRSPGAVNARRKCHHNQSERTNPANGCGTSRRSSAATSIAFARHPRRVPNVGTNPANGCGTSWCSSATIPTAFVRHNDPCSPAHLPRTDVVRRVLFVGLLQIDIFTVAE